jgi:predicted nucleotidyltransferase
VEAAGTVSRNSLDAADGTRTVETGIGAHEPVQVYRPRRECIIWVDECPEAATGEPCVQDVEISDPRLAEVVRRLIEAYAPERVYLFGSSARGDSGPDSDYDLLLVVPDGAPPERKRSRLAYERLWGTGTAVDVLVWTQSAFDRRLHLRTSLPATVVREGKLLHAA